MEHRLQNELFAGNVHEQQWRARLNDSRQDYLWFLGSSFITCFNYFLKGLFYWHSNLIDKEQIGPIINHRVLSFISTFYIECRVWLFYIEWTSEPFSTDYQSILGMQAWNNELASWVCAFLPLHVWLCQFARTKLQVMVMYPLVISYNRTLPRS